MRSQTPQRARRVGDMVAGDEAQSRFINDPARSAWITACSDRLVELRPELGQASANGIAARLWTMAAHLDPVEEADIEVFLWAPGH